MIEYFGELKNNGSGNEIGVSINKNQWYHLICIMSKDNGNMKIYLDGELEKSQR